METQEQEKVDGILTELEDQQALEGFVADLDALESRVTGEHEIALRTAMQDFSTDPGVRAVREDAARRTRAAFLDERKTVAKGEAELEAGLLGPKKLEELKAKAAEDRLAGVFRERSLIEATLGKVSERFNSAPLRPSAEVLALSNHGHNAFPNKTGSTVFREVVAALEAGENELLELYGLPIVERLDTQPPRHARAFLPVFKRLRGVIETHLDTAKRGPHKRTAEAFAAQALQEFDWATNTAAEKGWDDLIMSTGAPSFRWTEGG